MLRSRLARCEHAIEEEFGRLTWAERGFFFMLAWVCDRLGYTPDKPAQIRAALAPYDAPETVAEVKAMLDALVRERFVERFEADGERWLWMRVFPVDQKPHPNETASTAPRAPGDHRHRASPAEQQQLPLVDQGQTKGKPRSPGSNPVSGYPVTGGGEGSDAAAPAALPPPPPSEPKPEQGTPTPAPAPERTTEDYAGELATAARVHLVAPGGLSSVPDNREFKLWCEFVERVAPELRPALVARASELMQLAAADPHYGRGAATPDGRRKFTVTNPFAFVKHYSELADKFPTALQSPAQEALLSEAARDRKDKAERRSFFEQRREALEREALARGQLTRELEKELAAQAAEETRAHFARAGPAPGPAPDVPEPRTSSGGAP